MAKLRIYDGDSFKLVSTVEIGEDADNVRYDPEEKYVFVAYGGEEQGGISRQRSEHARACGLRPETDFIWQFRPALGGALPYGSTVPLRCR